MCPKCGQDNEFYTSVQHMCKTCWSNYQKQRRLERLKDVPLAVMGQVVYQSETRAVDIPKPNCWESDIEAGAYLAAIIDGEGSVAFYHSTRQVTVTNTDLEIIYAVCHACDLLGITYKVRKDIRYKEGTKDSFTVFIFSLENFKTLSERVPLRSVKRHRLNQMIDAYCATRARRGVMPV